MTDRIKPVLFVLPFLVIVSCNYIKKEKPDQAYLTADSVFTEIQKPPTLVFGIPADSFNIISGHIKPNGFLSDILLEHGITFQEIDQLIKNSSSVFDVRTIRAGNNYTLLCDNDSAARARYLVYEHDPSTSYIFSFNDSLKITPFRKEIRKTIRYASGTIETSLWESMIEEGLPPMLVADLSEIFAWTVDFFGLQK
jgi:hypothetical protein